MKYVIVSMEFSVAHDSAMRANAESNGLGNSVGAKYNGVMVYRNVSPTSLPVPPIVALPASAQENSAAINRVKANVPDEVLVAGSKAEFHSLLKSNPELIPTD